MADEKLTALAALAVPANEDLLYTVDDPSGVPTSKKITRENFLQPVLIDIDTLGPNAADSEFMVGTGAGALAWESGATLRTSIGVGAGDTPTFTGLNLGGAVGLDVNPGGDIDADLITVGVTDAPQIFWDESEDSFSFTKRIEINGDAQMLYLIGATSARFDLRDNNAAAGQRRFAIANNDGTLNISQRTDGGGFTKTLIGFIATTTPQHIEMLSTDIIQDSATGARPPLMIQQDDISEEMVEFVTTIGVGNAIEAVGAKTLTTTHFVKCTIPGPLTRYFEVGTIA